MLLDSPCRRVLGSLVVCHHIFLSLFIDGSDIDCGDIDLESSIFSDFENESLCYPSVLTYLRRFGNIIK